MEDQTRTNPLPEDRPDAAQIDKTPGRMIRAEPRRSVERHRESAISAEQVTVHLAYYAERYPSLITIKQAAEIAQVPTGAIYHWSALRLLDAFKSRRGRHVRLGRDEFVRFLLAQD